MELVETTSIRTFFFQLFFERGYQIGLSEKNQINRWKKKHKELGLTDEESKQANKLQWHKTKPAKLQFFSWQFNLSGLLTGSWALRMGHKRDCTGRELGLMETVEHLFMTCRFARRTWHCMERI